MEKRKTCRVIPRSVVSDGVGGRLRHRGSVKKFLANDNVDFTYVDQCGSASRHQRRHGESNQFNVDIGLIGQSALMIDSSNVSINSHMGNQIGSKAAAKTGRHKTEFQTEIRQRQAGT